jgi:3'-phosphoadenosine 5'-phosphosulfate sulfotransferase (PAPS reductase)/FAD synthetase
MTQPRIKLPEEIEDLEVIASVSGGKDSTALVLALREAEIPARFLFADTGWEAPETYDYLDLLRERLGIKIGVVGYPGGMEAKIRARAGFPTRMARWCTDELKIQPLRAWHDAYIARTGRETVQAVGVRAEESEARARLPELEDEPAGSRHWGGWVWRPLLHWSVEDVLHLHRRAGIPVNPLYQRGHNRVGCYPCIYAGKEEIRLIAEYSPETIDQIAQLEREMEEERVVRNAAHVPTEKRPVRYVHSRATYFQTRKGVEPMGIHEIVAWARTDRKGLPVLAPQPTGGCMRWGLCETLPQPETGEGDTAEDPAV